MQIRLRTRVMRISCFSCHTWYIGTKPCEMRKKETGSERTKLFSFGKSGADW